MKHMPLQGATSYKETTFGLLPRDEVIKLEVQATRKGLHLLRTLSLNKETVTPELIKRVHKECFQDILLEQAGRFRTIQVTYSSKEAPLFSQVPALMQQLCDDTQYALLHLPVITDDLFIERVVELIAKFQHRCVWIHPFVDYNGRTSRMFTNYLLMCLHLPIIEVQVNDEKDRQRYIAALQKADESDYSALEMILMSALHESLHAIEL